MHRIMVVDDEVTVAMALEESLSNMGYDVVGRASSGEAAIDMARHQRPDLVLMDIVMPGKVDGIDASEIIRKELNIPVIFVTAHAGGEYIERAKNVEPFGYILKPFEETQIRANIEIAIHREALERGQRIEKILEQSEQRLGSIVESVPDIIYELDSNRKITFINKAVERLLGYSQKALVGKDILELVHPDDREKVRYRMAERRKTGVLARPEDGEKSRCRAVERRTKMGTDSLEVRLIRRDKVPVHVLITSAEGVYKEGRFLGTLGVVDIGKDITDRKQAEEELRKINQELKHFAHVVSHDLKAPITHIQGFSSVLLENYQEKLGDRGRRCVERIEANIRRMEVLVSDLLALSSIGRVVSTFKDVPSLEIVRNVTSDLEDRVNQKGIELVLPDNLPIICCDGNRIYQVFENLLVNAIKFMRETQNPRIEIGCEDKEGFHQFYVRDNGIGIDPKYQRKIFERFQRLKETEDEEGTGLGLAIVDRIVSHHGGRVWVESEPGKGSTFYFTIPAAG
jgi:PAS domain S-box-containing protein